MSLLIQKKDYVWVERADLVEGKICPQSSPEELWNKVVRNRQIVILKSVFDRQKLLEVRARVFEWGRRTSPAIESDHSFHRLDDFPVKSQTPHRCHFYNLVLQPGKAEAFLLEHLQPLFSTLSAFQNLIAKTRGTFDRNEPGHVMRPQLIQYPQGGGEFGRHVHPFEPQHLGLIVGLSRKGVDYQQGGTYFECGGKRMSIEEEHDIGDIAIFRYDMPHGVSPVDPEKMLGWDDNSGRWTMILPYY